MGRRVRNNRTHDPQAPSVAVYLTQMDIPLAPKDEGASRLRAAKIGTSAGRMTARILLRPRRPSGHSDTLRDVRGLRIKTLLDVETAPNLGELGKKVTQQIELWGRDSYRVRSLSHACDPDADAEEHWSALIVFESAVQEEVMAP
jgi:hypothetical protein